ncbi:10783_t:CDS:2, partial [Dentiscutata heterogama]
ELGITSMAQMVWHKKNEIPEISDQQFVQYYLSNKEFDNYPEIKKEIIELFRKEYITWREMFLLSVENNLKTHKIKQNYFGKIRNKIKEKYNILRKEEFKLTFDFVKRSPPLIHITIFETQLGEDDFQNIIEDPNHVPTLDLQQSIATNENYYYGQKLFFDPDKYTF